jgi:hypothetical protein
MEHWETHAPWWSTGSDMQDRVAICTAIVARDENEVREYISRSFDYSLRAAGPVYKAFPDGFEWRFIEVREPGWSPFTDRFAQADWMRWPITVEQAMELRSESAPEGN